MDLAQAQFGLVGVGIYTPGDASRFTGVSAKKVRRWLRGHVANDRTYDPLWRPQIELGDDELYLGFRDLTEVRVADAFIRAGLAAQKVRRAIELARDQYGFERPLSTNRFRTDGQRVFLMLADEGEGDKVVDLFRGQYAMRRAIEPSFKGLEFDEAGEPTSWRIAPGVLLHPAFAFGQPIDRESKVPTRVLAAAAQAEGSPEAAARAYAVSLRAVTRAIAFESGLGHRAAA